MKYVKDIIQITACCDAYGNHNVYALCKDGTVWFYNSDKKLWYAINHPDLKS